MKWTEAMKDLIVFLVVFVLLGLAYLLLNTIPLRFLLFIAVAGYAADKLTDWLRER